MDLYEQLHSVLRGVLTFNISNIKKYMFLTPEFKYKSSGILDFFLCNHSPKGLLQKSTCIVLKNEKHSLIWQNFKGDF